MLIDQCNRSHREGVISGLAFGQQGHPAAQTRQFTFQRHIQQDRQLLGGGAGMCAGAGSVSSG